jgi:hypothetical protein
VSVTTIPAAPQPRPKVGSALSRSDKPAQLVISPRHQEPPDARRFWRSSSVLAAAGAIVVAGLGAAFLSIGHSPQPRDLPLAFVGDPTQAQGFEAQAHGTLSVRAVPDSAAAEGAIRDRDVYGAVVPGRTGIKELLIAPAASNQTANFLRNTLGKPTKENVPRVVEGSRCPQTTRPAAASDCSYRHSSSEERSE